MKVIKYNLISRVNIGTLEEPIYENRKDVAVTMPYSETNLAIAKSEAWEGLVEVTDDGEPDPIPEATTDDILNVLLGVTV